MWLYEVQHLRVPASTKILLPISQDSVEILINRQQENFCEYDFSA